MRNPPFAAKHDRKKARQEAEDDKLLREVFEQMAYTTGATGAARETLCRDKVARAEKRAALHASWDRQVYQQIVSRIQAAVGARDIADVEARLQSNAQAYIDAMNRKTTVFRDVIIEGDYDPLPCARTNVKVATGDLVDPLATAAHKAASEAAVMGLPAAGRARSKTLLPTEVWADIESTPYGHNTAPDGTAIVKPVDEKLVALQQSRVMMDHYTYPTGNAVAAAEVPVGKAAVPPLYYARTGRTDLFGVLQQSLTGPAGNGAATHAQAAGGLDDTWLAYRGRRIVPGPELRRGRKNLYDVVHHTCVEGLRKKPEFTGGDEWLERRGRRTVPGPEQRRGRKNLFETFQMATNPFHDGRTLDDSFLEAKGRRRLPVAAGADMYGVLRDQRISVAAAPAEVPRYCISELVPVDGSLTTRTVPNLTQKTAALA